MLKMQRSRLKKNFFLLSLISLFLCFFCSFRFAWPSSSQAIPSHEKQKVEDVLLRQMEQNQKKFYKQKVLFQAAFEHQKLLTYPSGHRKYFAYPLNDAFAFLHIFKTGGTTVEKQIHGKHIRRSDVGNRSLVATVRDPLDHFLSGWAECGSRRPGEFEKTLNATYDERIQSWLGSVIKLSRKCKGRTWPCPLHSYPQANFMLTRNRSIDPLIAIVGDMRELSSLLEFVGFRYDYSIPSQRNASTDETKYLHFPKRKDLLSNETLQQLCDFLQLDYFLFDFEPPAACRDPNSITELTSFC